MANLTPEKLFSYKGRDKYGRKRNGMMYAMSKEEVSSKLAYQGVNVKRVDPDLLQFLKNGKKPSLRDLLFYTQQMATSLRAGIPVDTALRLAAENSTNLKLRTGLRNILADVESGDTLHQAFAKQDEIFDKFYVALVGVGERSGNLEYVLQRLANALDKLTAIRRKVVKAMTYPAVVFVIGLLVIIGLLVFVIPQFEDMFASFGAELPLFTQLVLAASKLLQNYFLLILAGVIGFFWFLGYLFKTNDKLRYWKDDFMLNKMPLFKHMTQQGLIARFGRTLSTLYDSGTPMTESLEQTAEAMNNLVFEEIIHDINGAVSQGDRLADAMRGTGGFTELTTSMVEIGEETGQLHTMLDRVSETYEAMLDDTVDALTTFIEPLMILFLGVMVAIVLAAIYLPIFSLGNAL